MRSVRCYPIAAAERGSLHLRLTARGVAGHASRPGPTTAVSRLVDALHRLAHHPWPIHLSPAVRAQLQGTADALGVPVDLDTAAGVQACLDELGPMADVARFTVRAQTTPTMLSAGYKVNVLPATATAEVDVRCPPGYAEQLEAMLPELIGDEVEWEHTAHSLPVSAPVDGPWFAAMRDAALGLKVEADAFIVDGNAVPTGLGKVAKAVVSGDALSLSVAAASIIAKVTRDRMMREYAVLYPQYGFEVHMGYPTKSHVEAIRKYGPCPIHRMTFGPLKALAA